VLEALDRVHQRPRVKRRAVRGRVARAGAEVTEGPEPRRELGHARPRHSRLDLPPALRQLGDRLGLAGRGGGLVAGERPTPAGVVGERRLGQREGVLEVATGAQLAQDRRAVQVLGRDVVPRLLRRGVHAVHAPEVDGRKQPCQAHRQSQIEERSLRQRGFRGRAQRGPGFGHAGRRRSRAGSARGGTSDRTRLLFRGLSSGGRLWPPGGGRCARFVARARRSVPHGGAGSLRRRESIPAASACGGRQRAGG
jgi:hypothetical protein